MDFEASSTAIVAYTGSSYYTGLSYARVVRAVWEDRDRFSDQSVREKCNKKDNGKIRGVAP